MEHETVGTELAVPRLSLRESALEMAREHALKMEQQQRAKAEHERQKQAQEQRTALLATKLRFRDALRTILEIEPVEVETNDNITQVHAVVDGIFFSMRVSNNSSGEFRAALLCPQCADRALEKEGHSTFQAISHKLTLGQWLLGMDGATCPKCNPCQQDDDDNPFADDEPTTHVVEPPTQLIPAAECPARQLAEEAFQKQEAAEKTKGEQQQRAEDAKNAAWLKEKLANVLGIAAEPACGQIEIDGILFGRRNSALVVIDPDEKNDCTATWTVFNWVSVGQAITWLEERRTHRAQRAENPAEPKRAAGDIRPGEELAQLILKIVRSEMHTCNDDENTE